MNDKSDQESYRAFQLMTEIEAGEAVSQRELAGRLGIAVGLVNSCLKNFVAKGYVRVKSFPRKRYAYLLTPKGFAEKSRIAFQHLHYFAGLYTTTRRDYLELFKNLRAKGVDEVVFCGVDEVAEIAYLSLQESGLRLAAVMNDVATGGFFFGMPILPIEKRCSESKDFIVITSLKRAEVLLGMISGIRGNLNDVCLPGWRPRADECS